MAVRQFGAGGRLGHRGRLLQHPRDLLQRRRGRLERVVELREVLQRVEEPLQVEQERGQHADLDVPVHHPQPAVEQDRARGEVADQRDRRGVHRDQPGRTQRRRGVAPVQLGEDLLVTALAAERLDGADAAERLHESHDDLRDRFPAAPVDDRRLAPEPPGEHGQRAEPGQHDQRQRPVEQQHPDADQEQREDRRHQGVQAVLEQVRDRVDVGDLPGDHAAGGVVLVERDRQPLEVREQPLAEFQHDVFAELAYQPDEGTGRDRLDGDGGKEPRHDDRQRHRVTAADQRRDALVDAETDQPGPGQGGQVRGHDQDERAGHRPLVRPEQIGQQPPGPPPQQHGHAGGELVRLLGGDATPGIRRHPATFSPASLSPASLSPASLSPASLCPAAPRSPASLSPAAPLMRSR